MKKIIVMLILALLFVSCGSSSKNIESINQNFRILKVVENIESSSFVEIYYEYNEKNLLSKKITLLADGTHQATEEFIYNSSNQLIQQSKQGHIAFTYSAIAYKYGNLIYNKTNLPVIVSHDANSSFFGTLTNTHVDYSYNLNEQNSATSLESTIFYRNTTGSSTEVPEEETVTQYSYDAENRLILKDTKSYSYNEFNKLALESESNYKILYFYDENHRIVLAKSFSRNSESEEWILGGTKSYFYENGLYDTTAFTPNYFDQGQYISSGIY